MVALYELELETLEQVETMIGGQRMRNVAALPLDLVI